MITKMSELFLRTLRDDPADAEVPSHKLLVRAGYVRRVAPGIYSWLPLGYRLYRNVERVIREEMDAIGGQEIHLPALLPREPYQVSGRDADYGDLVFRLQDRKRAAMVLGPTHEELFTQLVKGEYTSYRDFPVILYQIQTKYRDEERPRAGILRGREFVMKDSYSFDLDDDSLARSYQLHRQAYIRIFSRLGLDYAVVTATNGAMGGSASEEFLALSPSGEDTFVRSESGYAANTEAVTTAQPAPLPIEGLPQAEVLDTPETPTISTLVAELNTKGLGEFTAADTLKNVMVTVRAPGQDKPTLLGIGVPGDREVDLKRLEAALEPAEVALLTEEDFRAAPYLVKGYIGPMALAEHGVRYLVDPRVATGTRWATGADESGKHVVNLVCGRDFTPSGTIEAAEVRDGDPAPDGSGPLVTARGIEIGHIFQLGRKFADAFALDALGPDGKPQRITMGSYGIGVSRAVAAIAEQHHDENGLVWPRSVAPADVHLVIAGKDERLQRGGAELAAELDRAGVSVLLDDRSVSPGVAFADAELVGVPTIVVVGRGYASGTVEIKDRSSGARSEVALDEAVQQVLAQVRG